MASWSLAVAMLCLVAGCYSGCDTCVAQTEDDLREAASDDSCRDVLVRKTDLTTLAGLEEISHPMNLSLWQNAALADVSAVQRIAGTVDLDSNPSLVNATLGIVGEVHLRDVTDANFPEPVLEELSVISGDVLVGLERPGEPRATRVSVTQNAENGASLRKLSVGCDEPCLPLSLYLRADNGFTTELVLDGVGYDELFVQSNALSLVDLQRLLVPTAKVGLWLARRELADAYLAWLQSQGFAGEFDACVAVADVRPDPCVDRVIFP